jgi:hypothetical protein
VAAGDALPTVDVMPRQAGTDGEGQRKRKEMAQDDQGEVEQEEEEAMRGFVVEGMNGQLFRELMDGFHGFRSGPGT